MRCGSHGVWISFRSSTKLCLYDSLSYLNLLEVDYTQLTPSPPLETTGKVHMLPLSPFLSVFLYLSLSLPPSPQSDVLSANLRVTSLLADGDFLYIGSGCGELLQFKVVAGVSDPAASIRDFVAAAKVKPRGRSKRRSGDEPPSPTTRGGLLTKAWLAEEKDWVEVEQPPPDSYYASRQEQSPPDSYYASRQRRTQFGRTLRRGRSEVEGVGPDHLSVYRLEPLSHKLLGSALNEPVRVLLPIG